MTSTPSRAGDTRPGGVSRTPPALPEPGHAGPHDPLPPGSAPPLPVPGPVPSPPTAGPAAPWADPDAAFYTVGQVGELLGVPAATLRRFDLAGAVSPARSSGGQRRYSHRQLEHARRLLRLVDEGLTLTAATRVADLEDTVAELRQQLSEARSEEDRA